jgi:hypothetical protein
MDVYRSKAGQARLHQILLRFQCRFNLSEGGPPGLGLYSLKICLRLP